MLLGYPGGGVGNRTPTLRRFGGRTGTGSASAWLRCPTRILRGRPTSLRIRCPRRHVLPRRRSPVSPKTADSSSAPVMGAIAKGDLVEGLARRITSVQRTVRG